MRHVHIRVCCVGCQREMNPANLARHAPYCALYGCYTLARVAIRKVMSRFGLSLVHYDEIVRYQRGLCAICGNEPKRLVVDHNHSANRFRGLICDDCNFGLGLFKDDPDLLQSAARYLIRDIEGCECHPSIITG